MGRRPSSPLIVAMKAASARRCGPHALAAAGTGGLTDLGSLGRQSPPAEAPTCASVTCYHAGERASSGPRPQDSAQGVGHVERGVGQKWPSLRSNTRPLRGATLATMSSGPSRWAAAQRCGAGGCTGRTVGRASCHARPAPPARPQECDLVLAEIGHTEPIYEAARRCAAFAVAAARGLFAETAGKELRAPFDALPACFPDPAGSRRRSWARPGGSI